MPDALQNGTFHIEIVSDADAGGVAAAAMVAAEVRAKPASILLLPTGRTPLGMYAAIVARSHSGACDLRRVQTFNLDEFYPLPPDHPGSYRSYMRRVLFDHVPIPPAQIHLLDSAATDPIGACAAYEAQIAAAGGVDLAILGIGTNGHIGFNEPGATRDSRTRRVTIRDETRAANAFLFDNHIAAVPRAALTVGIATILEARHILLLAFGRAKAPVLAALLHSPATPDLPASFLRDHPHVTILADAEAANAQS